MELKDFYPIHLHSNLSVISVVQCIQLEPENSGIGRDNFYTYNMTLNSPSNMKHRNCAVETNPFHLTL